MRTLVLLGAACLTPALEVPAEKAYLAVLKSTCTDEDLQSIKMWALQQRIINPGPKSTGVISIEGFKAVALKMTEEQLAEAKKHPFLDYFETNDEGTIQSGSKSGSKTGSKSKSKSESHTEEESLATEYWVTLSSTEIGCSGHFQHWVLRRGITWPADFWYDDDLNVYTGKFLLTEEQAEIIQTYSRGLVNAEEAEAALSIPVNQVTLECPDTQTDNVTWHLSAMTQDPKHPDNSTYMHSARWGQGVDVYILDTGIKCEHEEFVEGNCVWGANLVDNLNDDDSGHGTHIAASIAGIRNGVSKATTVVAVRIARDGNTNKQSVAEAIQFVVESRKARGRPSIINMSIQFFGSTLLNDAVNAAARAGVVVISAAGNGDEPSCEYSPSGASGSITVGLHDVDYNPQWSSFGKCVALYAPGYEVWSADNANSTHYRNRSGTSMAAPHVAAIAAAYLTDRPEATPASVRAFLVETAHRNLLSPLREFDQNLVARIPCEGSTVSYEDVPQVVDRSMCPEGIETETLTGASGNGYYLSLGNGSETTNSACWEIKCDGLVQVDARWITANALYYRYAEVVF